MGLLSEIIDAANKTEHEEIVTRIPDIQVEVDTLVKEVKNFLQTRYIKYIQNSRLKVTFHQKSLEYEKELEKLQLKLKKTHFHESEFQKYLNILRNCRSQILLTSKLCQFHKNYVILEELIQKKNYGESMETITKLEELIPDVYDEDYDEIIEELKYIIISKKTEFVVGFGDILNSNIILNCDGDFSLKINKNHKDLDEIIHKLPTVIVNSEHLHILTKTIIKRIFEPISNSAAQINIHEYENFYFMKMTQIDKPNDYKQIYSNYLNTLQFLKEHLNIPEKIDLTIFKIMISYIGDSLYSFIMNYFNTCTIPAISKGELKLEEVLQDTEKFQKCFSDYGLLPADHCTFIDHLKSYKAIYSIQVCQQYSNKIQEIIQENMIITDKVEFNFEHDENICMVSKNVIELLAFLKKITLLTNSENRNKIKDVLMYAVSTYIFQEPLYQEEIRLCSKSVAIYHNNCYYMSEKLSGWNENVDGQSLWSLNEDGDLIEIIHRLRLTGADHFSKYVQQQVEILGETFRIDVDENKPDNINTTIKSHFQKGFKLIKDLKNTWDNVLPQTLTKRVIGLLLNYFSESLFNLIQQFEEHSEDLVENFMNCLNSLINFIKEWFEESEHQLYVTNWNKIKQLQDLFASSLEEVERKWLPRKGTRSLFNNSEMRDFILLIFCKSEKRDALLVKYIN